MKKLLIIECSFFFFLKFIYFMLNNFIKGKITFFLFAFSKKKNYTEWSIIYTILQRTIIILKVLFLLQFVEKVNFFVLLKKTFFWWLNSLNYDLRMANYFEIWFFLYFY